jgi:hypothetical protein
MDDPVIAKANELLDRPDGIRAAPGDTEGWRHALLRAAADPTRTAAVRKLAALRAEQMKTVLRTPVLGFPGSTARG